MVQEGAPSRASRGLATWLSRIAPRAATGEVTIAILPDARVRALNQQYRRVDKATDVLSFPSGDRSPVGSRAPHYLGDIVISREIAQKQAANLGHPVVIEFRVLALHGLLHLLGYDHEVDSGLMARVEARLRRKAGLPPGLIARS